MLSGRTSSRFRASLLAVTATVILLISATGARGQTNYPVIETMVVTDANGHVVSGSDEVSVGQSLTVTAAGWRASSDMTLSFSCGAGDPVGLGTFKADEAGVVRADFVVPNAGSGDCALRLTGIGSDGNARSTDAAMRVKARTSVGGTSLDAGSKTGSARSKTARGGVFGKTGANVWPLTQAGFSLLSVGAVLLLGVRRHRGD